MNKSGHFNLYSKYIDCFNLFFKPHSSIFLTWPPLTNEFYCVSKVQFYLHFQNIIFVKDANFFYRLLYLLKELSSTFLFDKCITLKKKWICFNLNIFLSIFNVPMALAFKLIILEKNLFSARPLLHASCDSYFNKPICYSVQLDFCFLRLIFWLSGLILCDIFQNKFLFELS